MALTDAEIQRIRYEMGYVNLETAASAYIGIAAYFEQILQPYCIGGSATTSTTTVTAASAPTPTSIVIADATGFAAGDVVVVDVDTRMERATVQSLASTTMTLQLTRAHVGTYPVILESGESLIRDILNELRKLGAGMNGSASAISALASRAGLKRADDIEFFGGGGTLASQGIDPVTQTLMLREYWRDELAYALGIERLNKKSSSGGSTVSVY